jgi:sulfur carrier protein
MGACLRPEALRAGDGVVTPGQAVFVNGVQRTLAAGTTVDDVVCSIAPDRRGLAVAVNGEVVPRSAWSQTTLGGGDRLEVLAAAQGG